MKKTPGPWKIVNSAIRAFDPDFNQPEDNPVFENHGFCICILPNGNSEVRKQKIKMNAEHIITSANNYDRLLELSEDLATKVTHALFSLGHEPPDIVSKDLNSLADSLDEIKRYLEELAK